VASWFLDWGFVTESWLQKIEAGFFGFSAGSSSWSFSSSSVYSCKFYNRKFPKGWSWLKFPYPGSAK
jgi:hypothetical protein